MDVVKVLPVLSAVTARASVGAGHRGSEITVMCCTRYGKENNKPPLLGRSGEEVIRTFGGGPPISSVPGTELHSAA